MTISYDQKWRHDIRHICHVNAAKGVDRTMIRALARDVYTRLDPRPPDEVFRDALEESLTEAKTIYPEKPKRTNGSGGSLSQEEADALDAISSVQLDKIALPKDIAPAAYHGPLGTYARGVVDRNMTEASAPAVLVCSLAVAGALLGRSVVYSRMDVTVRPGIWALLAGPSSTGRKGTAMNSALAPLKVALGEKEALAMTVSGTGSGEGLVSALYRRMNADSGEVAAVAWEEEYSRLLKVAARDGSTASEMYRRAFDGGMLEREAKQQTVYFPHLSLIGAITPEELMEVADNLSFVNGFLNRHLMIASVGRRVREGGEDSTKAVYWLAAEIALVMDWVKAIRDTGKPVNMTMGHGTHDAFEAFRDRLDEQKEAGGVIGSLAARGETHVLRLAVVYAAMDRSPQIEVQHLDAAMAVWGFSRATASALLGHAPASDLSKRILRWVLSRGDEAAFSAAEISRQMGLLQGDRRNLIPALDYLVDGGWMRRDRRVGTGRHTVEFSAVPPATRVEMSL